jgi:RNA polymerase sigma-70 factor (ECF subfamily)
MGDGPKPGGVYYDKASNPYAGFYLVRSSRSRRIGVPSQRELMRLFGPLPRIPITMSAAISWLAPSNPVGTYFFSTLMADDQKAVAHGLRRRDPELLDRLIEQYQYRLYRYLIFVTGSPERAEDFFQETWIRVLERGHQYDAKFKFEAWLFTIARNLVIDWRRQKKMQSLDEMLEPEEGRPFEPVDERDESPLQQVLQSEEQEAIQASLVQLPAAYREVLLLRFQEEMQLEEIAKVQATPISTVKSRLYRGLEELKRLLAGPGGAA